MKKLLNYDNFARKNEILSKMKIFKKKFKKFLKSLMIKLYLKLVKDVW